jgi:DNA-binding transcriptional MerR regulator
MNNVPGTDVPTYTLNELCMLVSLPARTVRYYVQIGLVDRPEGETRAARYGARHLEQLIFIRKWTDAGISLERIRELLGSGDVAVPLRQVATGTVEVRSHITVAEGIEVVVDAGQARMDPDQIRRFISAVMAIHADLVSPETANDKDKK